MSNAMCQHLASLASSELIVIPDLACRHGGILDDEP